MLLFGEGASIDQDNNTLFNCVARGGYIDTVKLLLRKGAPIEAFKKDDNTPFHLATQNGHTRVVEVLLGKGTPMEAMNLESNTSFYLTRQDGHTRVVEVLLGKGTPVEAINLENNTLMGYCCIDLEPQLKHFSREVPAPLQYDHSVQQDRVEHCSQNSSFNWGAFSEKYLHFSSMTILCGKVKRSIVFYLHSFNWGAFSE